jgi:MYXO-CTERM domain-containing protein
MEQRRNEEKNDWGWLGLLGLIGLAGLRRNRHKEMGGDTLLAALLPDIRKAAGG